MDFKVSVKCCKCFCTCELRPQDFKDRSSMECPNCGQTLPDDVYDDLKTGIVALGRVPDRIKDEKNVGDIFSNCFLLSVKETNSVDELIL